MEPSCSRSVQIFESTVCHEGCFCADGTVNHNGKCIKQSECPCSSNEKEFLVGETIKQDCLTCQCVSGVWVCPDMQCGARCEFVNGIHVTTFDKRFYDFNSQCSYYLLQTSNFSIIEQYVDGKQNLMINSLFGSSGLVISIESGIKVKVNGKSVASLPKILLGGAIVIRPASSEIVLVEFDDGVRIWFDSGSRLAVDVPASYRGQTVGLCGTFTDNADDDFMTPENDHEATVLPFVDKWRVEEACDLLDETQHELSPCEANIEYSEEAHLICEQLVTVFADGNYAVSVDEYFENCMYDVCACNKRDKRICSCPIFAAYAAELAKYDIFIDWRQEIHECGWFL